MSISALRTGLNIENHDQDPMRSANTSFPICPTHIEESLPTPTKRLNFDATKLYEVKAPRALHLPPNISSTLKTSPALEPARISSRRVSQAPTTSESPQSSCPRPRARASKSEARPLGTLGPRRRGRRRQLAPGHVRGRRLPYAIPEEQEEAETSPSCYSAESAPRLVEATKEPRHIRVPSPPVVEAKRSKEIHTREKVIKAKSIGKRLRRMLVPWELSY